MLSINAANLLRMCALVTVVLLVLFAGESLAKSGNKRRRHRRRKARRGSKDGSTGGAKEQQLNFPDPRFVAELRKVQMAKKPGRASARPAVPAAAKNPDWIEATLRIRVPTDDKNEGQRHQRGHGKFGYHSRIEKLVGRVVHVVDPGRSSHFGCGHEIANAHQIPKDEPWIALISRGKCYFFNKIKLGERYNASAVVIYDDSDGKVQVMNVAGTDMVSLMVTKMFGNKLANLVDSKPKVYLHLNVGKQHTQSSKTTPLAANTQPVTGRGSANATPNLPSVLASTDVPSLLHTVLNKNMPLVITTQPTTSWGSANVPSWLLTVALLLLAINVTLQR